MDNKNTIICRKVWELHESGENNSAISKLIPISRSDVIAIIKYTKSSMFSDANVLVNQIVKQKSTLIEYEEYQAKLLEEKVYLEKKSTHYHNVYYALLPFRERFYVAITATLLIGFFAGGLLEKKMMNSQGYFLDNNQIFSQKK